MIVASLAFVVLFCIGAPLCLLLPRQLDDRFSAAPVLGLASLGIVATIGYLFGLTIGAIAVIAAVSSLVGAVMVFRHRPLLLIAFGVLLVGLCYIPFYLNGYDFTIFHTNPTDQINYLSIASGMRARSASELIHLPQSEASLPIIAAASSLFARPTAPLLLSVFAEPLRLTSVEAMMRFVTLLQAISAFGVLFFLRNVFHISPWKSAAAAGAYSISFFPAYIVDINALSSLSALSFPPVLVACIYAQKCYPASMRLPLIVALAGAAILVFYPESAPATGPAVVVTTAWLFLQTKEHLSLGRHIILAVAMAGLLVAPLWQGSVGFLVSQMHVAHVIHDSWVSIFDGFYTPYAKLPPLSGQIIDVLAGGLGLSLLAPSPSLPPIAFACWRIGEAVLFVSLLAVPVYVARRGAKLAVTLACLSSIALPIGLFIRGDLWAAGKSVSMISPLLFCAIMLPLVEPRRLAAIPAAFFVLISLIAGSNRLFYPSKSYAFQEALGYPKPAHLLYEANWNALFWKSALGQCHNITVNVENPFLGRVIETMLLDMGIPYRSINQRKTYYNEGVPVPIQMADPSADCMVRDAGVTHDAG